MRAAAQAVGVGLLAACAALGFALAVALAPTGAVAGTSQTTTAPPTTTEPPPTTTEPEPEPEPTPPPSPRRPTIADGVTVGGVAVGGLLPYEAAAYVRERFAKPLVLVVTPTRKVRVTPSELGARANVRKAIGRAHFARPGARVPLSVRVPALRARRFVERLGREYDRAPVDARQVLQGIRIRAIPSKDGRRLQRLTNARAIRIALKTNVRGPVTLRYGAVRPKVTERDLGPAVIILRESKKLRYFESAKLVRTFGVATGQPSFPTPVGAFEIVTLQRNPWWYPPPSDWAADEEPVPPGPGNPLGTRWMGLSEPYVGIHGTPDAASIGYSASHGCIRMRIPDAEWLFDHVKIGTPVFIVAR